ncbi:MAG: hypothetical protein OCU22_04565 [Canidatus Methanoxibalbensis ujae]|nr:hypothetical protein [Candidatus Methanoxibalbensis ujae]
MAKETWLRKQLWRKCEFIARIEDIYENYDQKKPYALMKDPSSGRFYSTNSSEKKDFQRDKITKRRGVCCHCFLIGWRYKGEKN